MSSVLDLLAKITIDTTEYDKGLDESKKKAGSFGESVKNGLSSAGSKFGGVLSGIGNAVGTIAKAGTAGIAAGSAAVGALTKQSVDAYASYEQLVGGVETLFGHGGKSLKEYAESTGQTLAEAQQDYERLCMAQGEVIRNADKAYETAGMSANEYLETVTSFSASLIQSLGGNTSIAAKAADRAIVDMSDNANKMGTSMESIQNAYNGFAKGNYTMLDNLKLGYGGTKKEMERLVTDAESLNSSFKATRDENGNLKMSFADIVDAVHIVQDNLGITGTTSREAATTIEGSLNTVKGAWTNLVAGFADPSADIGIMMDNLIIAIVGDKKGEGLLNNLLPAVQRALEGIGKFVEKAAPIIGQYLPGMMNSLLPPLISAATSLVSGLVQGLPAILQILIEQLPTITQNIFNAFQQSLPLFIELGKNILNSIYNGITEAYPQLKEPLDSVIGAFQTAVETIKGVVETVAPYVQPILVTLGTVLKGAFDMVSNAITFVSDNLNTFAPIVAGVVGAITGLGIAGIITTIVGAITSVATAIGGVISALSMIKSFSGLVSVITTLAGGPLVLIVAAIGAVAGAFIYLWNTSEDFRNFWIGLWDKIKSVAESVGKAVSGAFSFITTAVGDTVKKVGDKFASMKDGLSKKASDIKNDAAKKFGDLKTAVTDAADKAKTAVSNKFSQMKETVSNALTNLKQGAEEKWNSIKEKTASAIDSIKQNASEKWNSIKETVGNAIDNIKSSASEKWDSIKETVGSAVDAIKEGASEKFQSLRDKAGELFKSIHGDADSEIGGAKNVVTEAFQSMLNAVGFTWSLPTLGTDAVTNAYNTADNIIGSISGMLGFSWSLPDIGTLSLDNAGNIVSNFINDLADSFSGINLSLPDIQLPHLTVTWEDLGPISIPHIGVEWYAKAYNSPYLFKDPTVIGNMGFGDGAGSEIVYGHENLMRDIEKAVEKKGRAFAPVINVYTQEGQSNEEIAKKVMDILTFEYQRQGGVFA